MKEEGRAMRGNGRGKGERRGERGEVRGEGRDIYLSPKFFPLYVESTTISSMCPHKPPPRKNFFSTNIVPAAASLFDFLSSHTTT